MTPAGQQAYEAAQWAWEDPEHRVTEAQARVKELARENPDDGDVLTAGVMLSRLAGTLTKPARTISSQMGGGGADSGGSSQIL